MSDAEITIEAEVQGYASAPARRRLPAWKIKSNEELERVYSQAQTVETPRGRVFRLKDATYTATVEHKVDVESENNLVADPYWEKLGQRGRGAQALFDLGLKRKAYRYGDCKRRGEKAECSVFSGEHRFFKPYHCLNRFCECCGEITSARLFARFTPMLKSFFSGRDHPSGFTLASFDFTKRCDGSVPTSAEVRAFNQCVRSTARKAAREILRVLAAQGNEEAARALKSRKALYGILFVDEFGREKGSRHLADEKRKASGLNLHVHGRYYGPFLSSYRKGWEIFRDTWREETLRCFGDRSHGCWIGHVKNWRSDPIRAAKDSLSYVLKYVRKPAWETVERMAELELAFDRTRKVHAGGLWHGVKEREERKPHGSGYCPICAKEGRQSPLYLCRRFLPSGGEIPDYWPVEVLGREGYRDIEVVRHELAHAEAKLRAGP